MTSLGWAVAAALPVLVQMFANTPPGWLGLPVAMGLAIGLAQGLVLRDKMPKAQYWIPATAVGFLLAGMGTFVGVLVTTIGAIFASLKGESQDISAVVLPALFTGGLFLGLIQWLALAKIPTGGWWVIITPIAICVGGGISLSLLGISPGAINVLADASTIEYALLHQSLSVIGAVSVAGAASGAVSAIPIFWILRHQAPAPGSCPM